MVDLIVEVTVPGDTNMDIFDDPGEMQSDILLGLGGNIARNVDVKNMGTVGRVTVDLGPSPHPRDVIDAFKTTKRVAAGGFLNSRTVSNASVR